MIAATYDAVRARALEDLRRIGTVEIVDRLEAVATRDVPNIALIEYAAPPNYPATTCPLCAAPVAITTF